MITLNVDGAITENPGGVSSCGWVLRSGAQHVASGYELLPYAMSVNEAEYLAVIQGLVAAIAEFEPDAELTVLSDSKLIVNTINRTWKLKARNLVPFRHIVHALADHFTEVKFEWIPREENSEADALADKAIYG